MKKRKCRDCVNLEEFDFEKVGFRNKCALLDIWDMDPVGEHSCEYFQAMDNTMPELTGSDGVTVFV